MADDRILEFIDNTIETLIDKPNVFGGYYAIEMQVLRLLETRQVLLYPDQAIEVAEALLQRFVAQVDKEYPGPAGHPLYVRVGYNLKKWTDFLKRFAATVRSDALWPPRVVSVTTPTEDEILRLKKGSPDSTTVQAL